MPHSFFDLVVPGLIFWNGEGGIDLEKNSRYAQRAVASCVDLFILSGSTAGGQRLSPDERAEVLDLWLSLTTPSRLIACCWGPEDFGNAADRSISPMAVLHGINSVDEAISFMRELPGQSYIYSHPIFGAARFDATMARSVRLQGVLPRGGKVSKVNTGEIRAICTETGPEFRLWDGSCRHIDASLHAGAAGVVATPLSAFDWQIADRSISLLQEVIDPLQGALDGLPNRAMRVEYLIQRANCLR